MAAWFEDSAEVELRVGASAAAGVAVLPMERHRRLVPASLMGASSPMVGDGVGFSGDGTVWDLRGDEVMNGEKGQGERPLFGFGN